ncbi:MAG: aminoglycoside phosphotransferase family protein [Clostridia bacterium]|nr:aminoglycoside phosphotransferase family protein [Clostridia bacterium]
MIENDKDLRLIVSLFNIEGEITMIKPYGEGLINSTLLVTTTKRRYILQRINTNVFKQPNELMNNICAVTEYLHARGVETLEVVHTKAGDPFLSGEICYRLYVFIEDTVTYQKVPDTKTFYNCGKAFGEFQNQLSSFDASVLTETILNFHNTPTRFEAFKKALEADVCGRAAECKQEIDFVLKHADTYYKAVEGLRDGSLPLRVTHNDTKINNILMDNKTNVGRAIIDLDTVMPGAMMYDFGDSIRSGANTAAEDEPDLDKVHLDFSLFKAYAEGFCSAVKESITKKEKELLAYGAYLMTVECGIRFLTDYLSGDTYFKIKYPTHNIVRTRAQLRLASEIEENLDKMNEVVFNACK